MQRHRRSGASAWAIATLVICALGAMGAGSAAAEQAGRRDSGALAPAAAQAAAKERFRPSQPMNFGDHRGFVSLFDGHSLAGWDGDPTVWRVENGAIVGERAAGASQNNDYLVFRGVKAKDFDLKVEIRVLAGGSGIQYRSQTGQAWLWPAPGAAPKNLRWMLTGPQADLWAKPGGGAVFNGQVYIENSPRGIVAWRGEVTEADRPMRPRLAARIGDRAALGEAVSSDWNQYEIIARGGVVMQILNGQLMAVHIDDDAHATDNQSGLIGIEAEMNPARVEVRSVWLRKLN